MRRLFWLGLGAAAGIAIARRLGRAAQAVTPAALSSSLAESLRELGDAVHYSIDQVRDAMSAREAELYDVLGVEPPPATPAAVGTPALSQNAVTTPAVERR